MLSFMRPCLNSCFFFNEMKWKWNHCDHASYNLIMQRTKIKGRIKLNPWARSHCFISPPPQLFIGCFICLHLKCPPFRFHLLKAAYPILPRPAFMRMLLHPPTHSCLSTLASPLCWGIEPAQGQEPPLPLIRQSSATSVAGAPCIIFGWWFSPWISERSG